MILSSRIEFYASSSFSVSIIGVNNLSILCVNGGSLDVSGSGTVRIEGITWIRCGSPTTSVTIC